MYFTWLRQISIDYNCNAEMYQFFYGYTKINFIKSFRKTQVIDDVNVTCCFHGLKYAVVQQHLAETELTTSKTMLFWVGEIINTYKNLKIFM